MARASEYLQWALERAVATVFPGVEVPIQPVRQVGKPGRQDDGRTQRTVTWSLARGPVGARIDVGPAFMNTIDGSSPLTRTYLIEIHEPYGLSETGMTDVKKMAAEAMSAIERLSEAIRIKIAGAAGAVMVEFDEVSDASQQRGGYLSRLLEITLPAEFLPDFVSLAGRLSVVLSVSATAPDVPAP